VNPKLDSSPPSQAPLPIRSCNRCGGVMAIVRTMLNSTTGKTIRMFEYPCEGCRLGGGSLRLASHQRLAVAKLRCVNTEKADVDFIPRRRCWSKASEVARKSK
jgi:hypothetical protein